jgi:hypothetical protein
MFSFYMNVGSFTPLRVVQDDRNKSGAGTPITHYPLPTQSSSLGVDIEEPERGSHTYDVFTSDWTIVAGIKTAFHAFDRDDIPFFQSTAETVSGKWLAFSVNIFDAAKIFSVNKKHTVIRAYRITWKSDNVFHKKFAFSKVLPFLDDSGSNTARPEGNDITFFETAGMHNVNSSRQAFRIVVDEDFSVQKER